MVIIENKYIPFKGYLAMNICGLLFVRKGQRGKLKPEVLRHERIHSRQWLELLIVGFLLWYSIEWFVKLWKYTNGHTAYRNISLEREAYANEADEDYLRNRKPYAWVKYIFKNV